MSSSWYRVMLLVGIVWSAWIWRRRSRGDQRLGLIYLAALLGGFAGAKLVYVLSEGWIDWQSPDRWVRLASGKTVVGALLGGFASVECAKSLLGYHKATGDLFAAMIPVSIALGRIGCCSAGCCLGSVCSPAWYSVTDTHGVARWPSVQLELAFNLACLPILLWFRRTGRFTGQHFHLYIISYGVFRILHETQRETPRALGPVSGYQIAALLLVLAGVYGYARRRRVCQSGVREPGTLAPGWYGAGPLARGLQPY